MPEGPSLFKWCTMTKQFLGQKIMRIAGSSKTVNKMKWNGACLEDVRVYGKRLFLHLIHKRDSTSCDSNHADDESVWIRCHFLMWGSVRVNEFNCKPSKTNQFPEPRLVFYFSKDEFLVFYGGSFQEMNKPPEDESRTDILSNHFDISRAVDHILEDLPISFTLLDQRKFTGLGNIIKNEVLFSTGTHPMQIGSQLSKTKATKLVDTVVTFTKKWLSWKMDEKPSSKFGDWTEIYKKATCPNGHKTTKSMFGPMGMERITYWCPTCQPMDDNEDPPLEKKDVANTPAYSLEGANKSTTKEIPHTISDSEHHVATAAETSMTKSLAACQHVPMRAVLTIEDSKQDETVSSNQERKFVQNIHMMQESHSYQSHCGTKSEQTLLVPPSHQTVMNGTPISTLSSLQTELNSFRTSHDWKEERKENPSPLSMDQPRQRLLVDLHTTKKIKLEAETTSDFNLNKDRRHEPVSHFIMSPSDSSCNVKSICVQDKQHHEEELTRISVSLSTIKVLMRSRVRVNVKKLELGAD